MAQNLNGQETLSPSVRSASLSKQETSNLEPSRNDVGPTNQPALPVGRTSNTAVTPASQVDTEFGNLDRAVAQQSVADKYGTNPTSEQTQMLLESEDGVESATTTEVGESTTSAAFNKDGIPNPLLGYPSYTYNISLHALWPELYNSTILKGKYEPQNNVLIASAGRYGQRMTPFNDIDFFFDNFKMTTVIGLNQRSQGANAVDVSFTIIEPNGVTLLNRIIETSYQIPGEKKPNYLEVPYMLMIEFVGYDNDGLPLPNTALGDMTKFIPIKIVGMKMKVSTKGAEYQIRAVPYNHLAFSQTVASIPVDLAVTASTVGEFFKAFDGNTTDEQKNSLGATIGQQLDANEQRKKDIVDKQKEEADNQDGRATDDEETPPAKKQHINPAFEVSSFTDAIDAHYKIAQRMNKWDTRDNIEVQIDPAIAKASIVDKRKLTIHQVAIEKNNSADATGLVKTDTVAISINAGTSILQAIEIAILSSNYIRLQVNDPAQPQDIEKIKKELEDCRKLIGYINWYKVVPEIRLGEYDSVRREFSKTLVYHIRKHILRNNTLETAPMGLPSTVQKNYNYIFTGENNDILDFQIDFDALYYTAVSSVRGNAELTNISKDNVKKASEVSETEKELTEKMKKCKEKFLSNHDNTRKVAQGLPKSLTSANGSANDSRAVVVHDLKNSLMSSARGDMINLKLKILGDPHFIKQDDVFYNYSGTFPLKEDPVTKTLMTPNNSISTDAGEVYAFVSFKTPVDFDPATGMNNTSQSYVDSKFDGIYKVVTVESLLASGKFEQTLDMIRMPNQEQRITEMKGGVRENTAADTNNQGRSKDSNIELCTPDNTSVDIPGSNASDVKQSTMPDGVTMSLDPATVSLPKPSNYSQLTSDGPALPTQSDKDTASSLQSQYEGGPLTPEQARQNRLIETTVTKQMGILPVSKLSDLFNNGNLG